MELIELIISEEKFATAFEREAEGLSSDDPAWESAKYHRDIAEKLERLLQIETAMKLKGVDDIFDFMIKSFSDGFEAGYERGKEYKDL